MKFLNKNLFTLLLVVSCFSVSASENKTEESFSKECYTIQFNDFLKNSSSDLLTNFEALNNKTKESVNAIKNHYHSTFIKSIVYNTNKGEGTSITLNLYVCE